MRTDVIADEGLAMLGSRLKRLAERLQGDASRIAADLGLPVQPSQMPLLTALHRHGALSVGEAVEAIGISQPAVTRILSKLVAAGLVAVERGRDRRRKTIVLTAEGEAVMVRAHAQLWPRLNAAVGEICAPLQGGFLDQVAAIERALAQAPLDRRPRLRILPFSDALAPAFHDINAAWIAAMFRLEPTDVEVLENPRDRIIAPGGDILFVEAAGAGVVGTCALQRTGEGCFELTKMGVTEAARGRKAGEFLLHAAIARAAELGAERLYLLTNAKCRAAIHLYEKAGFVHDAGIMSEYGARYARCDVAMLYRPPSPPPQPCEGAPRGGTAGANPP